MDPRTEGFTYDVVVVGGAGHVGLPLAIAFASGGLKVCIYDINEKSVATVLGGELPFREDGAQEVLRHVLDDKSLTASTDDRVIGRGEHVVVVIGTPVDEHLNPDPHAVPKALHAGRRHLRTGQLLILRSTVYPGVTKRACPAVVDGTSSVVGRCPHWQSTDTALNPVPNGYPRLATARSAGHGLGHVLPSRHDVRARTGAAVDNGGRPDREVVCWSLWRRAGVRSDRAAGMGGHLDMWRG